ncbi:MAG: dicarboxylate/amino acid:cation symporter [Verrucomicrobiota bacterium]|jgi:Na+/H+-dicarboxylate symporter|nr:dicarboxylate/amino acid:cation symporter [Verrucomicrobiota bacterium]
MPWYRKLHWQIIIGMVAGLVFGIVGAKQDAETSRVVSPEAISQKQNLVVFTLKGHQFQEGQPIAFSAEKDHNQTIPQGLKSSTTYEITLKDGNNTFGADQFAIKNISLKQPSGNPFKLRSVSWGQFTSDWISPFGQIFLNLLKLIAMPLVLTSLICGVASLTDFKKLSRLGGKTIGLYLATTTVAVTIGLLVVNTINPGDKLPDSMKADLKEAIEADKNATASEAWTATDKSLDKHSKQAAKTQKAGPLQPVVDMVPGNFFGSASNNSNMLQIVFVSLLLGIALVQVNEDKRRPVLNLFSGFQEVVIKVVFIIMMFAPIGVFALIANTITSLAKDDPQQILSLLGSLGWYCVAVVIGLLIHGAVVYLGLLKLFTKLSIKQFFKGIGQAQLLAFSTSSSGATLPVTMKCAEENLGVSKEVSSFVLPLGATINMDGTALYQAVAAVFIAQASGFDLTLTQQVTIVLTAVLASIGTAAVPGAGIVMLIIILQAINVPEAGIALIFGVDRILDMCRTTVNITGDSAVASIIAASENQLDSPSS